ncbi:hypothetical protein PRCB_22610 [Pantoea rodasii]|uniref:Uncharacterized protein n=2 Tax=Pantoea rodasii TaxID=1076549 RepID=A0A2M9W750_9GAMM|nr:hypothetical protein HA45_05655 [Pantoea rodasii]PJZ03375.1 hypothetical protein PRCB_22610 [Pantoea rodasii]
MESVKALNMEQLNAFLSSGKHPSVIIGFNLTSDAFFNMAAYWRERGVTIDKHEQYFVAKSDTSVTAS